MSHVELKKRLMSPVEFKKCLFRPVEFKKLSCFMSLPFEISGRMSLRSKMPYHMSPCRF